jgi:hypothetical protein
VKELAGHRLSQNVMSSANLCFGRLDNFAKYFGEFCYSHVLLGIVFSGAKIGRAQTFAKCRIMRRPRFWRARQLCPNILMSCITRMFCSELYCPTLINIEFYQARKIPGSGKICNKTCAKRRVYTRRQCLSWSGFRQLPAMHIRKTLCLRYR